MVSDQGSTHNWRLDQPDLASPFWNKARPPFRSLASCEPANQANLTRETQAFPHKDGLETGKTGHWKNWGLSPCYLPTVTSSNPNGQE